VLGIRTIGQPIVDEGASSAVIEELGADIDFGPPPVPGACAETGCGGCGDCCGEPMAACGAFCFPVCCIPVPCVSLEHFSAFGGVTAFKGPPNRGRDGSFGFHEGVNWGTPLPLFARWGFGLQMGAHATHTNFSGAGFATNQRNQFFATGGVFRRVDWGLQGGFVFDFLHDDWYVDMDLFQIRGELSWVYPCWHELGVRFAANVRDDTDWADVLEQPLAWETTDYYVFFYRRRFDQCGGAQASLFAGASGSEDGLLGADIHLPMNQSWALNAGFSYLIPNEAASAGGAENESWNLAINLVWYPRCRAQTAKAGCFEPLLPVADNGSVMIDVK